MNTREKAEILLNTPKIEFGSQEAFFESLGDYVMTVKEVAQAYLSLRQEAYELVRGVLMNYDAHDHKMKEFLKKYREESC